MVEVEGLDGVAVADKVLFSAVVVVGFWKAANGDGASVVVVFFEDSSDGLSSDDLVALADPNNDGLSVVLLASSFFSSAVVVVVDLGAPNEKADDDEGVVATLAELPNEPNKDGVSVVFFGSASLPVAEILLVVDEVNPAKAGVVLELVDEVGAVVVTGFPNNPKGEGASVVVLAAVSLD